MQLRAWSESDACFVCYMRNDPNLNRFFRQDRKITLKEQKRFIRSTPNYHAYIIYNKKKPIGIIAVHYNEYLQNELCYVGNTFYKEALDLLIEKEHPSDLVAPVFATNPILKDLLNYGFEVTGVKERAHYKRFYGPQDLISLHLTIPNKA